MSSWSDLHYPDPKYGWDKALTPFLQQINKAGWKTSESCQGGEFNPNEHLRKLGYLTSAPFLSIEGPKTTEYGLGSDSALDQLESVLKKKGFRTHRGLYAGTDNFLAISNKAKKMTDARAEDWWQKLTNALVTHSRRLLQKRAAAACDKLREVLPGSSEPGLYFG